MMAPSWAKWKMTQEGSLFFWWLSDTHIQIVRGEEAGAIDDIEEIYVEQYKSGMYNCSVKEINRSLENK